MGLETGTWLDDLVTTNPVTGDKKSAGDDHLRLIKTVLRNTFPVAGKAFRFPRASAKTSNYTVLSSDDNKMITVDVTGGSATMTLPTLSAADDGWSISFAKIDASANTVLISATIDGDAAGFTIVDQYQSVKVVWTGTAWLLLPFFKYVSGMLTFDAANILGALTVGGLLTLSSTSHFIIPGGTTAQRPGSPAAKHFRYNTDLTIIEWYDGTAWRQPLSSLSTPLGGLFRNLNITQNTGTPNTKIDVVADELSVATTGGVVYRLTAASHTIDGGVVGANGIDAGALANSSWYAVWEIYNPTTDTKAGLLSASATAPTMPSGYTAKARLGWVRTDGSAHFVRTIQRGRHVQYVVSGSAGFPVIAQDAQGVDSGSAPTWATPSITGVVPTTAEKINLMLSNRSSGTSRTVYAAPNNSFTGIATAKPPPIYVDNSISASALGSFVLEGTTTVPQTTIAVVSGGVGGLILCTGWEDNL